MILVGQYSVVIVGFPQKFLFQSKNLLNAWNGVNIISEKFGQLLMLNIELELELATCSAI